MAGDVTQEALEARPSHFVPTSLNAAEYQTGAPRSRCSDLEHQRELIAQPREGSAPGIIVGDDKISIVSGSAPYVARPYENVIALEGTNVQALFGSRVQARSGAHVEAACGSTVEAEEGAVVNDQQGSVVIALDEPSRGRHSAYPYLPRLQVIRASGTDSPVAGQSAPSDHFAVLAPRNSRVTALSGLSVIADLGADVVAGSGSDVTAYERSVVRAGNGSRVEAHLDSRVTAENGARVVAHSGGAVVAEPGANVVAMQGAHVYARDGAHVWAESGAKITAQRDAVVEGPGAGQVERESALRRWWGRDMNVVFEQLQSSHRHR
ncbi:MAG: hypothetical protein JSS86_12140 [Cyanobacteria bacterium SZAS LIN-2]|nr:hypothetical protein [Cyanobacteria bacterium SZAS LIN-3]MBS1997060.1 hypothetical protein [Cyanobacteria bacterium SZAS LIN-2]